MPYSIPRILIIILIQIIIALIHAFRLGQIFNGQVYNLYYSYFSDLILPFGAYFLLSINDARIPVLRQWYVKAGIIFSLTTFAEICQLFGFDVLGVTFDPVDFIMYGIGILTAAIVEKQFFERFFSFWLIKEE